MESIALEKERDEYLPNSDLSHREIQKGRGSTRVSVTNVTFEAVLRESLNIELM